MTRRAVLPILIVTVALGACRREAPPAPPAPAAQPEQPPPPPPPPPPAEDPAALERAETERAMAILLEMIHFDFDRYDIRPDAEAVLLRKVPILRANPQVRLRIEGHTDERGSLEYNQALGQRRANSTRDFLVSHGLDANRFETVSFGEERPLDPRSTEEAWDRNRRAEFYVTAAGPRITIPATQ